MAARVRGQQAIAAGQPDGCPGVSVFRAAVLVAVRRLPGGEHDADEIPAQNPGQGPSAGLSISPLFIFPF